MGYLLQYFQAKGIPVLGVEPAQNVAKAAEKKGVPTLTKFFGTHAARELEAAGQQADLIVCNNVLAHVPDLKDFVAGLKLVLKPRGIVTVEVPHLLRLIKKPVRYDLPRTFFLFSFCTARGDIPQTWPSRFSMSKRSPRMAVHFACMPAHAEGNSRPSHSRVSRLRQQEIAAGMSWQPHPIFLRSSLPAADPTPRRTSTSGSSKSASCSSAAPIDQPHGQHGLRPAHPPRVRGSR